MLSVPAIAQEKQLPEAINDPVPIPEPEKMCPCGASAEPPGVVAAPVCGPDEKGCKGMGFQKFDWGIQPNAVAPPVGRVIQSKPGRAIVNLGKKDRIRLGDHMLFYKRPDQVLGSGRVIMVSENTSELELGIDERVLPGMFAAETEAPMFYDTINPPRISGLWEIRASTRALMTLESAGVGSLSDLSIGYRGRGPYFFRVTMEPSGGAFTSEKTIGTFSGHAWLGYDNQNLEVGLGAGYSTVNKRYLTDSIQVQSKTGGGFSLGQSLRLGSLDGAHLHVQTGLVFFQDRWRLGAFTGTLQIPFNHNTWILIRGGGSVAGYYLGEVGLRRLIYGNGDHGSLYIVPTIGGAQVYKEANTDFVSVINDSAYSGPMVGLGFEYRP